MKATGEDDHSRSTPPKRNECSPLLGGAMNPGHKNLALKHELFSKSLDLVELIRSVVRWTEGLLNAS